MKVCLTLANTNVWVKGAFQKDLFSATSRAATLAFSVLILFQHSYWLQCLIPISRWVCSDRFRKWVCSDRFRKSLQTRIYWKTVDWSQWSHCSGNNNNSNDNNNIDNNNNNNNDNNNKSKSIEFQLTGQSSRIAVAIFHFRGLSPA